MAKKANARKANRVSVKHKAAKAGYFAQPFAAMRSIFSPGFFAGQKRLLHSSFNSLVGYGKKLIN
ncbi:MAG: hypothetical protein NTW59_02475 [Candidatus Diapherotrites archaeon]|nr:hypothetical protein [Candidatus Diapherotrites archaeon]